MESIYFTEEKSEEFLLSEYLDKDLLDLSQSCDLIVKKAWKGRTEYLMDVLGDVPFAKDLYKLFMQQFQRSGGMYSVRTRPDTIKGMYEITRKYSMLSIEAIDWIWFKYIKDLFEEYSLLEVLDRYLEKYGLKDETFCLFLDFVDKKAHELQDTYDAEAEKTEEIKEVYSSKFIAHIKSFIQMQHYRFDEIKKFLPDCEIIRKDEEHISSLSADTRIYYGCCEPVSYKMFDILLEGGTLDDFPEYPKYYISTGREELAKFTKQEFLDSIKKTKEKTLIKK